jgi:hypothetical protein
MTNGRFMVWIDRSSLESRRNKVLNKPILRIMSEKVEFGDTCDAPVVGHAEMLTSRDIGVNYAGFRSVCGEL